MKVKTGKLAKCCLEQSGKKLPFHLCCSECRKVLAAAEEARIRDNGRAPDECGTDMVAIAPARGRVVPFKPVQVIPDGEEGYKQVDMGYRDRSAMREEDVFDRMNNQVRRKKGDLLLPSALIGVGRDYRDLFEKVEAGNIKCSNLDGGGCGGGRVDFMDAYMRDSDRLARMQHSIGTGIAMKVQRMGRGNRQSISDRQLIDQVCLSDRDISSVLRGFGWSVDGKNRRPAKLALWLILERMVGI